MIKAHDELMALASSSHAVGALFVRLRPPEMFDKSNVNVVQMVNAMTADLQTQIARLTAIKRLAQRNGIRESLEALIAGSLTHDEVWAVHEALDLPG